MDSDGHRWTQIREAENGMFNHTRLRLAPAFTWFRRDKTGGKKIARTSKRDDSTNPGRN
jgi:hypothetical protein